MKNCECLYARYGERCGSFNGDLVAEKGRNGSEIRAIRHGIATGHPTEPPKSVFKHIFRACEDEIVLLRGIGWEFFL